MSQVRVPLVEPILPLLQVQVEGPTGDSVELLQASLSEAPETLDAVDLMLATSELILTMIDSEMLCLANINQAVITAPALRVSATERLYFSSP